MINGGARDFPSGTMLYEPNLYFKIIISHAYQPTLVFMTFLQLKPKLNKLSWQSVLILMAFATTTIGLMAKRF